jgi:hypothetical protein
MRRDPFSSLDGFHRPLTFGKPRFTQDAGRTEVIFVCIRTLKNKKAGFLVRL